MTHKFLLCQTHPKCRDLVGWYLEVCPGDLATLMDVHLGVCGVYWYKFGMDMSIDHSGPYNPLRLAAKWLQSVENCLLAGAVLINSSGGLMPREGAIVLDSIESDRLIWPDKFDDEIITISRWEDAKHYYLASNKGRIFVPDKYNEYADARRAALRHTKQVVSNC